MTSSFGATSPERHSDARGSIVIACDSSYALAWIRLVGLLVLLQQPLEAQMLGLESGRLTHSRDSPENGAVKGAIRPQRICTSRRMNVRVGETL